MPLRKGAALLAAVMLAACSSFDGSPEPVFDADTTVADVQAKYPFDTVVDYVSSQDGDNRKVYRNRVVASYLLAMDARYFAFRRNLSRNLKGGNIGFDLALLGLTGSAAIWDQAASELAAAATAVAGARSGINRELYFERTLPALIALMEAERLSVRAEILRGLTQSEDEYTVQEAFADLHRYEAAASIDGAIQKASEIAGAHSAQARYDYTKAVELCEATDELADQRRAFFTELENGRETAEGRERYARAAQVAGLAGAEATEDPAVAFQQQQAIADYLRGICAAPTLELYKSKVDAEPEPEGDA